MKVKAIACGVFVSLFVLYSINRVFFATFDPHKIIQHIGSLSSKPTLEEGTKGNGDYWKLKLDNVDRFFELDRYENKAIEKQLRSLKIQDKVIIYTYSDLSIPNLADYLSGRYLAVGIKIGENKSLDYNEIKLGLESTDNAALFVSIVLLGFYIYWLYKRRSCEGKNERS